MVARFADRVALVTGGGRGIGAATACLLASQGAAVAVLDLDPAPAQAVVDVIRNTGGRATAYVCDVADRAAVDATVDAVAAEHDRLDILVACAGVIRDNLLFRMADDDWRSVISTHLDGSFFAARAAQRHMVTRRHGRMIFLSSISALGNRGQANYATAKAGLQGLTKAIAIELGPFGITANAVAPGFVDTRMARAVAERTGVDYEEFKQQLAADIPLRRIAQPDDIASVIAFLASDEAAYVSGQVIYVAGGPRG